LRRLDRFGVAAFGLDDVDEGAHGAELADRRRICRVSLAFIVECIEQDGLNAP